MAEKRVSVRPRGLAVVGGRQVRAELAGVGQAGSHGFGRLSREMEAVNTRLVGAVELVYQFTRLVGGARGFGNALELTDNVARALWDGMKTTALSFVDKLGIRRWGGLSSSNRGTADRSPLALASL